ncbi:response regulator [Bremerella sp. JC817]|uniref:response regulator n=1 Tax=Bremerella sp. JC817 TaxID=3231756 RepID=UPI00345AEA33
MDDSRKILIVDDEHDIREGVSYRLRAAGYATLSAENGIEGIASARLHRPDAILLDVQMPEKDGIETLREMRRDTEISSIPIVMLSASLRDELRALDAGARFFVQKPYDGSQLLFALEAALSPVMVGSD